VLLCDGTLEVVDELLKVVVLLLWNGALELVDKECEVVLL